jgi:DNA polymerase-4
LPPASTIELAQRIKDAVRRATGLSCSIGVAANKLLAGGKTIGVKLRYADFQTVTRDTTLENATGDPLTIRRMARVALKRVALDCKLRLLGVRVGSLVRADEGRQDSTHGQSMHSEAGENFRLFD